MNRFSQRKNANLDESKDKAPREFSKCSVCGKKFKSRSHFDAICNLCWADNDMRPYLMLRGSRAGVGFVN